LFPEKKIVFYVEFVCVLKGLLFVLLFKPERKERDREREGN
jgi:hypothetical protein